MSESEYTSLAPQFTFADTLEEQEAQLKSNPLLNRMIASRAAKAGDPHRPIYHYVNPENTLNDPNGLCFWQGRWHLFYQGYPPEDPRVHWGHAISDDLIHWRDLPYAIYPDPEECCFSGATLVEDDRVIAMYHGTQVGNMVATSSDPLLLNWEKVTGQAVIPTPPQDGSPQEYTVFDPCIWKKGEYYYSLSAGMLPDGPGGKRIAADFLFRSKDLASWEYLHPFTEDDRFTLVGDDGACPYFWPIGNRWILPFFSHMSGGQYLLGDYDMERDKFVVTSAGLFNFGASTPSGVHAPSATPDGEGGVIIIHNMNPGHPSEGWNQIMSLPRRVTLAEYEDELKIEPAGDVESLRGEHCHIDDTVLPANEEVVLEGVCGQCDGVNRGDRRQQRADGRVERAEVAGSRGVHAHRLLQGSRLPDASRPARERGVAGERIGGGAKVRRAETGASHAEHRVARHVIFVDAPRRAVATAGICADRAGGRRTAAPARLHRQEHRRDFRQRTAVHSGAGLPRTGRQPRRIAASAGIGRGAGIA